MIGDSNDTDMRQPISADGIHIHVTSMQSGNGERFARRATRKDGLLTDYEISDLSMLVT